MSIGKKALIPGKLRPKGWRPGFQPGQSGNPGGRPKGIGWVRDLARGYTKEAIHVLANLMKKGKTESVRRAAAADLLERGWGKPLQQIELTRTPFDDMTADELRALESALANLAGEATGAAGGRAGETEAPAPDGLSSIH